MNGFRAFATAAAGILRRDVTIFLSYRLRLVATIAGNVLTITTFYYISQLVAGGRFGDSEDYFAFVVVGLVVLEVILGTIVVLPMAVRQELLAGTFERLVVSPFGPVASVASMTIFPFLSALVVATITLVIAAAAFGMTVAWSTAWLAVPAALLGTLAFAPFALFVGASAIAVKHAGLGAGFVLRGMAIVGGFFFPVALLPNWIEWTSEVQPFTPTLDLLRHLLVGTPIDGSPWGAAVRVSLFAIVLLPFGIYILRAAVRYGQRRGTIIEY